MKAFLLWVLCGLVALVLFAAALLLTEAGQTRLVRMGLGYVDLEEVGLGFERVKVGLNGIKITGLRIEAEDAAVSVPSLELELPLIAAARDKKLHIIRLDAREWSVELKRGVEKPQVATDEKREAKHFELLPSAYASAADSEPMLHEVFRGIFSQLLLPVDLTLDLLHLEGRVHMPTGYFDESLPEMNVIVGLVGGGLGAGRTGQFTLEVKADAENSALVHSAEIISEIGVDMESPRQFSRLGLVVNSTLGLHDLPEALKVTVSASASQATAGSEDYTLRLNVADKRWFAAQARLSADTLLGNWALTLSDSDLTQLRDSESLATLVSSLPLFDLQAEGNFELDSIFSKLRASGHLQSNFRELDGLIPELPPELASLSVETEFTLEETGLRGAPSLHRIEKLRISIAAPQSAEPLLVVESLQPFELKEESSTTGSFRAEDPTAPLLAIETPGLPLTLFEPFAEGVGFGQSLLRGRFEAVLPNETSVALRTITPLRIDDLSLVLEGEPALQGLSLSMEIAAEHDLETAKSRLFLRDFELRNPTSSLLSAQVEAGYHAGAPQGSATGQLRADLASLAEQPLFAEQIPLERGTVTLDFTANATETAQELSALLDLQDLRAQGMALPSVEATLRAQHDGEGRVTVSLPLTVKSATRQRLSDLTLEGTAALPNTDGGKIKANITGKKLFLDDFQFLIGLMSHSEVDETPSTPFLDDWSGEVAIMLDSVSYLGQLELRQVGGKLKIGDGKLRFEDLSIGARASTAGFLRGLQNNLLGNLLGSALQSEDEDAEEGKEEANANPLEAIKSGLRGLWRR